MSSNIFFKKKVTVIGDTSNFHLGSKVNYRSFRKLVARDFSIVQEIPYDAFGTSFTRFDSFLEGLKRSQWWGGINQSDTLIVHGEGLTEKDADFVFPYLYFSRIGEEIGIPAWLVNFSMYEPNRFVELIDRFSYVACRDIVTQEHLAEFSFEPTLSFDCCVLDLELGDYTETDNSIGLIRGRNKPRERDIKRFKNRKKYDCCWSWEERDAIKLQTIEDYLSHISKSRLVLSTSFHGNIMSFLSGVPFVSLDTTNPKYSSLERELSEITSQDILQRFEDPNLRFEVYSHYTNIIDRLRERALLNCKKE